MADQRQKLVELQQWLRDFGQPEAACWSWTTKQRVPKLFKTNDLTGKRGCWICGAARTFDAFCGSAFLVYLV